jgi:5'-nucleotidase
MAVKEPSVDELTIYSDGEENRAPEVRLLHFNDVYHVDASSAEPVGGVARFQTVCNYYRNNERFKDQPDLVTVFSGDAFNPSLESTVTKGASLPL